VSRAQRDKGARIERELVVLHQAIGVHAERVPLSGAARYQGGSHDVDVYAFGRAAAPLVTEVKARATARASQRWSGGWGRTTEPVVVLPWRVWTLRQP
jgi:hypothetical protein